MDSVVAKKAATLLLKKVERDASKHNRGSSGIRTRDQLKRPDMPLQPSVPPIRCDNNKNVDLPRRRLVVKLRIKEPERLRSILDIANGAHALRQIQSIPELDANRPSVRRSSRKSGVEETATMVTNPPPNALNLQRKMEARNHRKALALAKPGKTRRQLDNLRLAGLDDHTSRPYLSWQDRNDIERGLASFQRNPESSANLSETKIFALQGAILHVDFSQDEIEYIMPVVESVICNTGLLDAVLSRQSIENLMKGREDIIRNIVTALHAARRTSPVKLFRNREESAITAFLHDAAAGLLSTKPEIKRVELRKMSSASSIAPPDFIGSIIRQRETWGRRRNPASCRSFKARLSNAIEDEYIRKAEWTDSSGDIATITWIDGNTFFCGATTHSDEHNMQYNKPGNLMVGNAEEKTLKSVPGHQIVRPIVTKGENALESMRGTQDPWMYCSVTSTAFSHDNRKCFTGSYDQTVKVWDVANDGSLMSLCGIWSHSGNVNFVVASPNHGLVATAADVREDAVRVYHFDPSNITASPFSIYEASVQRHNSSDTWAYFPSTMQWGISPSVAHLLLVGYSPRSFNCHDEDIPEEKLNSGELCLWDSRDGSRIPITSARTQNVFEVCWHPTQPIFVAATSPAGIFEDWVKTQLRVFEQKECGSFSHVKTLDCPAIDINEITIM
jgi:WD40 repeat protein